LTDLEKNDNDDVRRFLGLPVEGEKGYTRHYRSYTPRPVEDLYDYFMEAWDQGIKAVTWHQYTPYFNDGEPCEFSVYDMSVTSNEEVAEYWLDDNFHEERLVEVDKEEYEAEKEAAKNSRYSYYLPYEEIDGKIFKRYEEGAYDYIPSTDHPDGLESADVNIPVNTLEFEDALRTVFGDHTQVVVTPIRVVQFDYEHE